MGDDVENLLPPTQPELVEDVPPVLSPFVPPPPERINHFTAATVLAWVIVLAMVVAMIVIPLVRENHADAPVMTANEMEETPPEGSLELRILGKYWVATRLIVPMTQDQRRDAVSQLGQVAESAPDRVRLAVLKAELIDPGAAIEDLTMLKQGFEIDLSLERDIDDLITLYQTGPEGLSGPARERLIHRHQWFARLAIAQLAPPDDPLRSRATQSAMVTFFGMLGLTLGGGLMFLVGLGLLITFIVQAVRKRWRYAFQPNRGLRGGARSAMLEMFALYLLTFTGMLIAVGLLFPKHSLHTTWLYLPVFLMLLAWPRLRGMSWHELRQALGLHRGRGVLREVASGLYGYVAGLPVLVIGGAITFLLIRISGAMPGLLAANHIPRHPIVAEFANGARLWQVVGIFLLGCVWAPVVEELLFRGAFYFHLRQRFGYWVSALIVALVFAIIHPQGWMAVPLLGGVAMVLAGIREWRGSIIASMTAHAFNNAIVITFMLLFFAS